MTAKAKTMGDWHAAASGKPLAPTKDDPSYKFTSRRSPFLCRNACVATSQPLSSSIGLECLRKGANAADTAVAIAAALAVLEPCSTGLGGDMFCLYYDSSSRKVTAINGSGKSPKDLSMEVVMDSCGDGFVVNEEKFCLSAHAVTVPGAARGWEDLLTQHGSGKFTLQELLEPAAILAEEGFPVSPVTAHHWSSGMPVIKMWMEPGSKIPMTVDGTNAPKAGEIFVNQDLARVLREFGSKGATDGFYNSATGKAIVEAIQKHGGVMTMNDLTSHSSLFPQPMAAQYRNVKLWQVPPNGQGVAALIALAGLQHLEESGKCPKISPDNIEDADAYHVQMEMMRLGFKDAREHVACPDHVRVTHEWLLDAERIGTRAAALFDPNKAVIHGTPLPSSCTVSFQVVDREGNAVSFVNRLDLTSLWCVLVNNLVLTYSRYFSLYGSNFMGFGTGIVPEGCGFTLQNRGFGFTLTDPSHPNALAGAKRPYHTIIPGMLTYADTNELYATLSNMGGNMQPQGHLQLTVNMVAGEMDAQAAIDKSRFCIASGTHDGIVQLEQGVSEATAANLKERGHLLQDDVSGHARSIFGRAQIIHKDRSNGVLWAGSDGRADGCAMGF